RPSFSPVYRAYPPRPAVYGGATSPRRVPSMTAPGPDAAFPVDLTYCNITLRKEIGKGGFSTVWRASSPEYVYTLAVKFLDDSRYKDLSPIEEAIREFRSTQELRCAFIVPVERSLRLTGKPGGDRYPIALVMQHH